MVIIDSNLFVIGGEEKNNVVTGKNEMFNLKTKLWEQKSPLNTPRWYVIRKTILFLLNH